MNKENKRRQNGGRAAKFLHRWRWQAAIGCTALAAVLGSAYALTLPTEALGEKVYCGQEEHTHTFENCYEHRLVCGYEEGAVGGHVHEESCYQTEMKAICGQEESEEGHQHSEGCFEENPILICGQEETGTKEGHVHADDCYKDVFVCGTPEHTHTLACQSNPGADVETADQWKNTFREVKLSGDWAEDLLAIAQTQIGYAESTQNYKVEKQGTNGEETTMGYTRYGAWYGKPYEKWNAMFVSFCLNYAGIPADVLPQTDACQDWIGILSGKTNGYEAFDLYRAADGYEPKAGDLIFLDANRDGSADRVGIVSAYDKDRQKTVQFIEGDTSDQVAKMSCGISDPTILGYAELPTNPNVDGEDDGELPIDSHVEERAIKDSTPEDVIIGKFNVQYVSGAEKTQVSGASEWNGSEWVTKPDGEAWVWDPTDTPAGHSFLYRVNYTFSGVQTLPAGAVQITLPAHILRDRDGNWADTFDCPYLKDTEVAQGDHPEFVYKVDEEKNTVTIYNLTEWTAGMSGYIEFSYTTSKTTLNYQDLGASTDVEAQVAVTAAGSSETKTEQSTAHGVVIDTHASIASTSKEDPTQYTEWQREWGEAPADKDDYYYLVYPIYSVMSKNTQPYRFQLTDTFKEYGGSVVKYQFSGENWKDPREDGSAEAEKVLTGYGYRYDYVLVRYRKDQLDQSGGKIQPYEVKNTATATVKPVDGVDPDTSATGNRNWKYEDPVYKPPGGHFDVYKHGQYGKYDTTVTNSENISSYLLAEYLAGKEVQSIDELHYLNYIVGFPYPWTVEDKGSLTGTEEDASKYGKKPVTYELKDETISLQAVSYDNATASGAIVSDEEVQLEDDDYDMTGLRWNVEAKVGTYNANKKGFVITQITDFKSDLLGAVAEDGYGRNTVYLYAKVHVAGVPKWEKIAEYDLEQRSYKSVNRTYVESANDQTRAIVFRESARVKGYQILTSNAYYYTKMSAQPSVRLNRTAHIAQILTGKPHVSEDYLAMLIKDANGKAILTKIAVTNKVNGLVHQDDREIFEEDHSGTDYVRAVEPKSLLKKNAIATKNSKLKKQYAITWQSVLVETYVDAEGTHYIPQEGGVFYDLLPTGAVLDPETIEVRKDVTANGASTSGTILSSGEYTYEVVENYQGSGRQMLIVTMKEATEKGYSLTYDSIHVWPAVQDHGKKVVNQIAYETGNDSIADGLADDGTIEGLHLTDSDSDDGADTEKFLYKDASFTINAMIAANTGLMKQVRAQGDAQYTYDTTVQRNGAYTYWIRYANDANTESDGIILMDSIENFVQSDGVSGGGGGIKSDWKGKLTGIDLSQLKQKGVDPVVYVSTIPDLNLNDFWKETDRKFDLGAVHEGQNVWQKMTEATDLSKVSAVAIDCRKGTYGDKFRLGRGDSLSVMLYMQAPDKAVVPSEKKDTVAYNNIYVARTAYDVADPTVPETDFYHQDYTQVRFRVVGDVLLKKVNADNTSEGIKGVTYKLRGTSDYGKIYDMETKSDRDGNLSFEKVEMGTYELIEISCGDDWQLSKEIYTVKIETDGSCTVTGQKQSPEKEDGRYLIPDEPRIHADVEFVKTDCVTDGVVQGAKFQLSGTSTYGNDILLFAESDEQGRLRFGDLELGTYTVTEISAPDGYIQSTQTWNVVVDAGGAVTLYQVEEGKLTPVEIGVWGKPAVENEPLHQFTFVKTSTYGTNVRIGGVEFTLTGTSDYGHEVNQTAVSSSEEETYGFVTFSELEPGTYSLVETSTEDAKDNSGLNGGNGLEYVPDGKAYTVKIRRDGTFTISGLTMIEIAAGAGEESVALYNFPNTPKTGVVKVSKVWLDENGGADRKPSDIDITISTQMPSLDSFGGKSVTFDAGNGSFPGGETQNQVVFLGNGTPVSGAYVDPTPKDPNTFLRWTDGTKTVTVDESGWPVDYNWGSRKTVTLKAKYAYGAKYAVRLWGIKEDVNPEGNTLGLTFGPATGERYMNIKEDATGEEAAAYKSGSGYVAHISKADADAGGTCLHWMTWKEIVAKSKADPEVFRSCLEAGCTHSVSVKLLSTDTGYSNYDMSEWTGDGASVIYKKFAGGSGLNWREKPTDECKGGWPVSNIRCKLNGGGVYGTSETDSLFYYFEDDLRDNIATTRKKSDQGVETTEGTTTDDKLWLLCAAEVGKTGWDYHPYSKYTGCQKYSWAKQTSGGLAGYCESESINTKYWLRNSQKTTAHTVVLSDGKVWVTSTGAGLAPAFCIP